MEVIIQPQEGAMDQQSRGGVLLRHFKKGEGAFLAQFHSLTQAFFCEGFCVSRHSRLPPQPKHGLLQLKSFHLS